MTPTMMFELDREEREHVEGAFRWGVEEPRVEVGGDDDLHDQSDEDRDGGEPEPPPAPGVPSGGA